MDRFSDVVINRASLADGDNHGFEVVVFQHHIRDLARHIRAGMSHSNANISSFECRAIVNAIARHGHHLAGPLQGLDDLQLMGRADPGKHMHLFGKGFHHLRVNVGQVGRIKDFQMLVSTQS